MHTFKPGITVFFWLLPILIPVQVLITVLEEYATVSWSVLFTPKLFIHAMIVFLAHASLLTGLRPYFKKPSPENPYPEFSLTFIFPVLGIVFLPIVIGLALTSAVLPEELGPDETLLLSVSLMMILCWVSITCFGMRFPNAIHDKLGGSKITVVSFSQMPFIAGWIAVWTIAHIFVVFAPFLWAVTFLPEGQVITFFVSTLMGILSFLPTCLFASVLSHAFLRANDLPPQGLIARL